MGGGDMMVQESETSLAVKYQTGELVKLFIIKSSLNVFSFDHGHKLISKLNSFGSTGGILRYFGDRCK